MPLSINLITIFVIAALLIFLLRGIKKDYSGKAILFYLVGSIDNTLFLVSLASSVYLTKKVLFDVNREGIYLKIYNFIPDKIAAYLVEAGMLVYLVITPLLLLLMFFILVFIRSFFDKALWKLSDCLSRLISKTGTAGARIIGITTELLRGSAVIIGAVFVINQAFAFFPGTALEGYTRESRAYSYIDRYVVSPVLNSSLGSKVPFLLKGSVPAFSDDIKENEVQSKPVSLETLGYIRFQYETRSNKEIDDMAIQLVAKETDERKKAFILYKWIGNSVEYDWDKFKNIVNNDSNKDKYGAIPAFNTRKGVCEDYSDLYVAMARAVGLKVRITVGQGYSMGSWGGHAWNEVYIPKEGKWIPLDTTWAQTGDYFDTADFYKDHIVEAVAGEWQ